MLCWIWCLFCASIPERLQSKTATSQNLTLTLNQNLTLILTIPWTSRKNYPYSTSNPNINPYASVWPFWSSPVFSQSLCVFDHLWQSVKPKLILLSLVCAWTYKLLCCVQMFSFMSANKVFLLFYVFSVAWRVTRQNPDLALALVLLWLLLLPYRLITCQNPDRWYLP